MAWSDKYKKSIDCDNPKGFSQGKAGDIVLVEERKLKS